MDSIVYFLFSFCILLHPLIPPAWSYNLNELDLSVKGTYSIFLFLFFFHLAYIQSQA